MKPVAVEIEIDGPRNENLHFRPLERNIRGKLDLTRVPEPLAMIESTKWPTPIPSQKLGIDRDGVGYVREPLWDEEHKALKEKIDKKGQALEPKITTYEGIDLPTWYFWMKQAVESTKIAHVTKGQLPEVIEGKPKLNFVIGEAEVSSADKLTAALERQSTIMEKLLEKLAK